MSASEDSTARWADSAWRIGPELAGWSFGQAIEGHGEGMREDMFAGALSAREEVGVRKIAGPESPSQHPD